MFAFIIKRKKKRSKKGKEGRREEEREEGRKGGEEGTGREEGRTEKSSSLLSRYHLHIEGEMRVRKNFFKWEDMTTIHCCYYRQCYFLPPALTIQSDPEKELPCPLW